MSNINPNNIDGTFPIQGQDNPSQGFRDNFTNIRNNFSYAQTEINDLQSKSLTTSALTGQTLVNNMSYNPIVYAQLTSPSYTFLNLGTPTAGSTVTLDYSQSSYQKFTTNGNYTIAFSNWATSGQMSVMTLIINVTSSSHVITFPTTFVTTGLNEIAGANAVTGAVTFDQAGTFAFLLKTTDGGTSITITDLSRNYSTLRDPNLYWNDETVSTLLVGFGASQTMFETILAFEGGQDAVAAFGSYNSVAAGNLSIATINSPMIDTGQLGGYSVSALRGNLQTSTLTVASSNDFLGYVNAITYTGTGANQPPTFEQVSAIGFYATGSNTTPGYNYVNGIGGNIALFTHQPGATGNLMVQAVGIENDQSVKFFGNVTRTAGFVDQGYQYLSPTTGFWANIAPGKARFIMDPAGTLATGGITLPNVVTDGTIISIHSTQTITAFSANTLQSGTTIVPTVTTLASGTGIEYFYHATENKWYKIR